MKSLSISIFLAILILFLLFGCGIRKVDVTRTENIEIENSYQTGEKIILGNTFIYKPFDVLKPMVIEGKTYHNTIISNDKTIIKEKWNNRYITKTIIIEKKKETIRKDNTWLYLGIVLIIGCLVFLWFYLPRIKTGI